MTSELLFFVFFLTFPIVSAESIKTQPETIPTQVVEYMFYAHPVTKDGIELNLYTDSGGGVIMLRSVVDRLHLPTTKRKVDNQELEEVSLPDFQQGKGIPPPLGHDSKLLVMPDNYLKVILGQDISGMLGQEWFADRVWTWDYPGHKLLWRTAADLPFIATSHRVQLGFPTDDHGKRQPSGSFPRIQVTIDDEVIDLLFDTGATTTVKETALKAINDGHAAQRATSFINQSIFDRWHKKHPDWRVVENAESSSGAAMIEVPRLSAGGYDVGPVWFTARPDKNFEWMSRWMDKKIHGALGGSALRFFKITVDYPNAIAYFEKP